MLKFAAIFIVLSAASGALGQEKETPLAQCISAKGEMLGSIDIPSIDDGIAPDGACRVTYDKRRIDGTICIRPSSDPRAKACDTPFVTKTGTIGVLTCETSRGDPIGSLSITALDGIEVCAPCTLQIGSIRLFGRTVFYPFHGEPQRLCYVR